MERLMDGVTVVDSYNKYGDIACYIFVLILCSAFLFAFVYMLIRDSKSKKNGECISLLFPAICTIAFTILVSGLILDNPWNGLDGKMDTTYYECTVSDNVSFTKFTEKFKIIEEKPNGVWIVQVKPE